MRFHRFRFSRRAAPALALAVLLAAAPSRGIAAFSAGTGADYYAGPRGQSMKDVLGYVGKSWGDGVEATLAAARYTHSQLGPGWSGSGAASVSVAGRALIQILGARTHGDHGYRATRLQAGPVLPVGGGRTLGVFYTRATDNIGSASKGLTSELTFPISTSLSASARGSLASVDGGGTSVHGAGGLVWAPIHRVQLLTELGVGRDVMGFQAQGGLGILNRVLADEEARPDYAYGAAILVGMRYVLH